MLIPEKMIGFAVNVEGQQKAGKQNTVRIVEQRCPYNKKNASVMTELELFFVRMLSWSCYRCKDAPYAKILLSWRENTSLECLPAFL